MPIWKLTPTNKDAPDWEASTCREVLVIRANTEIDARKLATQATRIATERKSVGESVKTSPWKQSVLVTCESIQTNDFAENGPDAVLAPESLMMEVRYI